MVSALQFKCLQTEKKTLTGVVLQNSQLSLNVSWYSTGISFSRQLLFGFKYVALVNYKKVQPAVAVLDVTNTILAKIKHFFKTPVTYNGLQIIFPSKYYSLSHSQNANDEFTLHAGCKSFSVGCNNMM